MLLVALVLAGAPALAASVPSADDDEQTEQGQKDHPPPPPAPDPSDVDALPSLTRQTYRWLEPKWHLLPPNPYGQTDFTAYSLEFGEVKLGLASVWVGILPRTQIGTTPLLDGLGILNGSLKVNAVRAGPVDIAAFVEHHTMPFLGGTFENGLTDAGAVVSVIFSETVSVHAGLTYTHLEASGTPDLGQTAADIAALFGTSVDPTTFDDAIFGEDGEGLLGQAVTVRLASDIRFNRRDSLLLRAQAVVWARSETGGLPIDPAATLPAVFNLDAILTADGGVPIAEAYAASVAWQFSWKRVDLRLGVGISSVPFAWALQSVDLSYRFGGPTRQKQTRAQRTWKQNQGEVGQPVL